MRLIRRQASISIAHSARDSYYEGLQRAEQQLLYGMAEFMRRDLSPVRSAVITPAQRDGAELEAASVAADLDDIAEAVSVRLAMQEQNAKAGDQ